MYNCEQSRNMVMAWQRRRRDRAYLENSVSGSGEHSQDNAAQRRTARDAVHVSQQRNARIAQYDGHDL